MRIGSLFSGAGGLDMAVQAVFGGEVVWHSEIDKAASKVLAHRYPDVPNLGDITEINWANWKPMLEVDVLCGGFPCQDVSAAGKRAGIKDGTRSGLWAVFAEAIDQLRPQFVVIENVRGLLSATAHRGVESDDPVVGDRSDRPVLRALGAVLGDLSDLGYDARWATVAAASVGAPHRRERVFIVACAADAKGDGRDGRPCDQLPVGAGDLRRIGGQGTTAVGDGGGLDVSDSSRNRWHEGRPESTRLVGGFDAAVSGDEPGVKLLPTPCAQQSGNTPENHLAKKPGRKVVTDLAILVENGLLESGGALLPTPGTMDDREKRTTHAGGNLTLQGAIVGVNPVDVERHSKAGRAVSGDDVALLPTPAAGNFNDGEEAQQWLARQAAVKERLNNGNGMGMPLAIAVQLLPTPTAQDAANNAGPSRFQRNTLPLNTEVTLLPTPRTSDTNGAGHHGDGGMDLRTTVVENASQWGKYGPAIARWEALTRPAPAPTEPNKDGNPRLSAPFSEWLMGWPAGWVTDPDIGISRNDQLRIVGNGVCSQQAVAALRYLLEVTA